MQLELGPDLGAPTLAAEGTMGPTGRVDLLLPAPAGAEPIFWQAAVLVGSSSYASNRMETRIVPSAVR